MQAAWTAAVGEVASARFGSQGVLLSLPVALATLVAGYLAGRRMLQHDAGGEAGDATAAPLGARGTPIAALAAGSAWSIGAVWLGRHFGQDLTWLEALPQAFMGVWGAPLADALGLVSVFLLWWHGQRTGQAQPVHDSTVRAFGIGALAFAGALVWSGGLPAQPGAVVPCIVLFLGAGLPALSLARLREVRRDLEANVVRGEPARLDAGWWRTLAPPVVAILGLAAIAALLVADATARAAVLAAFGAAGEAMLAVLYWPVLVIGHLAEWLVYVLRSLLGPPSEQEAPPAAPGGGAAELLGQLQRPDQQPANLDGVRGVVVVGAVALVLYAFLATSRAVRRGRDSGAHEGLDRESLSARQLLLTDLGALWRALRRALGRRARAVAGALPARGGAGRQPAVQNARGAYRQLLGIGRAHAVHRRPEQTPDEYLTTWSAALPAAEEAAELTAAYRRARYGPEPLPGESPARLHGLLDRVRVLLEAASNTPRPRA